MRTKVNLFEYEGGGPPLMIDIRQFIGNVTDLAYSDYLAQRTQLRTGKELCDMFTISCRKGHERMASSLYNKVRWTLDTKWNG